MFDYDVVCLSHLRWDFVFQRPQHLLTRAARERRVFYVEEPKFHQGAPALDLSWRGPGELYVVVPWLPEGLDAAAAVDAQRALLDGLLSTQRIQTYALWYYTPMALPFSRHLKPAVTVYDCMDELSMFRGAPEGLQQREQELMHRAEVMFTGGASLFAAKRDLHRNVHLFPSSVDTAHFGRARSACVDPGDQAALPHPRAGYFGVIDERMDLQLLDGVAQARPDLQLVMLGPLAKVEARDLPRRQNIHWLGPKPYEALPQYISHWDVAMIPFARNDSTRFISPTKTPEYLAAGKPVVSTSIRDVVTPYGRDGLAAIADAVPDFVAAIDQALGSAAAPRQKAADAVLSKMSWDSTWSQMEQLLSAAIDVRLRLQRRARPHFSKASPRAEGPLAAARGQD